MEQEMPFAVTAVLAFVLLALTTSTEASQSCMTRIEARQHFPSLHLYLHPREHCWDTVPTPRAFQIIKPGTTIGQRARHQPSPKAAHEEIAQTRWLDRWVEVDRSQYPALARWIELIEVASPIAEPGPDPAFTPRAVVLTAIAIVLTIATIEVLFRCTIS
jgi:hypothetical protein